ncbi:MAG: CocE/NonD family hydrolase [Pseudomonadota bacterium]|jgi:putative CocE/NonD family hydrolase
MLRRLSILLLAASAAPALAATTQPPAGAPVAAIVPDVVKAYTPPNAKADYVLREVMLPMRDGVKLYTVIVMKKGATGGPILLSRTPYDAKGSVHRRVSDKINEILPAMDADFVQDGYIRVYQDIRGLHHSEGEFVMTRPKVGPLNATGIDEATDAYDTIDWLVKNVPESNGKVGVVGSSYLGFTTLAAEIHPHPALKAAAPQSPMVDTWRGDDDFHNGAFRTPTLDYVVEQSTAKADAGVRLPKGEGDDYSFYLKAGSVADYVEAAGIGTYPGVQKLLQNPAYTDFWSLQAVDKWMADEPLSVPTFLMLGQWDQEDSYGAPAVYRAMKPKDKTGDMVHLAIGPWRHSGVNHYGYDLGALTFTGDTAEQFRVTYLKPFFDHYLKGAPDPKIPAAVTYATGVNRWETSKAWPAGQPSKLYLHEGFSASFAPPTRDEKADDYVSDPQHPVPFLPRPIDMADGAQWKTWLVRDQRFVSDRPDVLSYATAPLDKPVHLMGAPQVELYAASSGTDSDFVVKLIDVYPDSVPEHGQGEKPSMAGYELPIGIEIFRGRYVHGLAKGTPLTPGKAELYSFALPNVDHVVLPGHRLMVQVQSSLFPLYDRNPQTFVDNIFFAKPADYRKATQTIRHDRLAPSAVVLPVAE